MHSNKMTSLFWLFALVAPLACSSSPGAETDAGADAPAANAQDIFWTAFAAGDTASGAADIPALESLAAGSEGQPDWYSTLLVGMDATWQLAEIGRDPSHAAQTGATYGPIAGQYLGQAHGMNPSDNFTTALTGFTLWNAGTQTQNPQQAQQGKALVDQAYAAQPELGWFLELIIAQFSPVADPQMQTAIDAGWKYFSICGGTTLDPNAPDFSAYLAQATTSTRRFCVNSTIAPHMVQGGLLYFGDLLVKAGSVAAAKTAYGAAQASKDYAAWPHKDVVDARATADLAARAAAYQGDPSTWPAFAASPYVCGTCHNTK